MELHERIKQRRLELGLSADEVAEALGVSRATIYRYESAQTSKMGADKLEPLAQVLRVTPEYLMGWPTLPNNGTQSKSSEAELEEYLEHLKTRPEMRMLFSISKNATKEDVMRAVAIIEALRQNGGD